MGRCSENEVFHMEGVDEEGMLPDDKKKQLLQGGARYCREEGL